MSQIEEKTELLALLKLLDDPDPDIYSKVEDKVLEIGSTALPYLENAFRRSKDQLSNNRIKTILDKIQFNKTSKELLHWKKKTNQNLVEGSLILASFHDPEINIAEIRQQINKIKQDVWLELNDEFTALEKIHILNHVLFNIYNFRGNKTNLSQPQNSLINDLLEKRQGNSVILSILYLEIAQSLDLPVYGVNLPENFILAFLSSGQLSSDSRALFYINPFNEGVVFTKEDINTFVKLLELEPNKQYFHPCHNEIVLRRLMFELQNAYELAGDHNRSKEMNYFLEILKG